MRLLLTSGGIKNPSIENALFELLGAPISECDALAIPTAAYGHPNVHPVDAWAFISGNLPMTAMGWKSMGVLELTALPSMDRGKWESWVRKADVFLVDGGDPLYLCYWMRQSGMADLMATFDDKVYVGVSAGSMVMTPRIGQDFVHWKPPSGSDEALGVVDFSIFPHIDNPELPSNTMAAAEAWAAGLGNPAYAMDDETAIKVVDGVVDVVSEGRWKFLGGQP